MQNFFMFNSILKLWINKIKYKRNKLLKFWYHKFKVNIINYKLYWHAIRMKIIMHEFIGLIRYIIIFWMITGLLWNSLFCSVSDFIFEIIVRFSSPSTSFKKFIMHSNAFNISLALFQKSLLIKKTFLASYPDLFSLYYI